jgi:prepilin-type N-terminal cleavage/methylation domain-containing protein/prepilin-type processing-associated H-X9-DG protein
MFSRLRRSVTAAKAVNGSGPYAHVRGGFSLIEILVVLAIISILMALYASTLYKALEKAKAVAVAEGARQSHIGRLAKTANSFRPTHLGEGATRDECREAYRFELETAVGPALLTDMKYVVTTEGEFEAYWNTLINVDASDPLLFDDHGRLIAKDFGGDVYRLWPINDDFWDIANRYGKVPVRWEFLSKRGVDTTLHGLSIAVVYADGHVERHVLSQRRFPAVPIVAELSDEFLQAVT